MQEFAFTVTYAEGVDDLMDVFITNPGLYSRTVSCHATEDTMWRVDEVTGPQDALAAYDQRIGDLSRCSNLRGMGGCRIDWSHEVLSEQPTSRVIYSQQSEGMGCRSIPYLVATHLGDGALCRAEQYGDTYRWRILTDTATSLSPVHEELRANLREGLELTFERVDQSPEWTEHHLSRSELSHEQREALELAAEYGYYRSPRQMSLQEIAEAEGMPVSTLQYRLTRAEARLVTEFLSETPGRGESVARRTHE